MNDKEIMQELGLNLAQWIVLLRRDEVQRALNDGRSRAKAEVAIAMHKAATGTAREFTLEVDGEGRTIRQTMKVKAPDTRAAEIVLRGRVGGAIWDRDVTVESSTGIETLEAAMQSALDRADTLRNAIEEKTR